MGGLVSGGAGRGREGETFLQRLDPAIDAIAGERGDATELEEGGIVFGCGLQDFVQLGECLGEFLSPT